MAKRPKLKQFTRTIDPKTGIHYLDGLDNLGRHWRAEMSPGIEKWLVYTRPWSLDINTFIR